MYLKLNAFMEEHKDLGFIAWIDSPKKMKMLVKGATAEIATKELLVSLKVSMAYQLGVDISKIVEKEITSNQFYSDLLNDLKYKGQKELQLQVA